MLPTARIPCFYPAPRTDAAVNSELTLGGVKGAEAPTEGARVQAFAVAVRALLGTTAEFAYLLNDDKMVVVEGPDELSSPEKYDIVARVEGDGMSSYSVDMRIFSDELK